MQTPDARLRHLRSLKQFKTAADAASFFGWNPNTYKSHENGIRHLSKGAAARYARGYNVAIGWLLFGESTHAGETSIPAQSMLAFRNIPRLSWDIVKNMTDLQQAVNEATHFHVASSADRFGPLVFALTIEDDSMVDADQRNHVSFLPEDEVLLEPDQPLKPGSYVLAKIFARNETIFRQYRENGYDGQGRKVISLHALNPNWADDEIVLGLSGEIVARLIRHSRNFS